MLDVLLCIQLNHLFLRPQVRNILLKIRLVYDVIFNFTKKKSKIISSDDMTIKLWNWDKAWACQQAFEGHTHYVMQIVINPKDNNTFASASLDR